MKQFILIFAACIAFGHSNLYPYVQVDQKTQKVGERCIRDLQCIDDAFCYKQQECMCDPNYLPSFDRSMCIPVVGAPCRGDEVCRTMSNAQCRQGVCACKDNFVLDTRNSSNCRNKPTREHDLCQTDDECTEALDRARCVVGKCRCNSGHHFTNQTSTCLTTRGLFEYCKQDYECLLDIDAYDALRCFNHQCICKEGDPRCSKGSLLEIGIMLIVFLLHLTWMF